MPSIASSLCDEQPADPLVARQRENRLIGRPAELAVTASSSISTENVKTPSRLGVRPSRGSAASATSDHSANRRRCGKCERRPCPQRSP